MLLFQVILAWVYSHVLEHILHRYLLHNPKRKRFFKDHFASHHKTSRKNLMIDEKYCGPLDIKNDPEIKGLLALFVLHAPVFFLSPTAYITLLLCGLSYYLQHRWAHQSHDFARKFAPWHYDHHMAPDQKCNWGVRLPFLDYLLQTRKHYKNTKNEYVKFIMQRVAYERRTHEARSCCDTSEEH